MVAFALLTGARDDAIASALLKHVDLAGGCFRQDAREVRTKFSKTFDTWFFPVGDEVRTIVEEWTTYLRRECLWSDDDPLFPASRVALDPATRRFGVVGLDRKGWSNAGPIRTIFRQAFEGAGLPYFNPHALRKTLARLGERMCAGPEEFKAWSQNLGHDHVMTTFASYGHVASHRQAEIMRGLGKPRPTDGEDLHKIAAFALQLVGATPSPGPREGVRSLSRLDVDRPVGVSRGDFFLAMKSRRDRHASARRGRSSTTLPPFRRVSRWSAHHCIIFTRSSQYSPRA